MNKRTRVKRVLSRLLILAGLLLVIAALALEAFHYPWRTLFSERNGSEALLPDPTPIAFDNEDRDSIFVGSEPEAVPTPSPETTPETGVLPGDENVPSDPLAVYVQLGILKIPVLGVSEYVMEGTERQMRYGVGHVEGSAGIGVEGNCALRDTDPILSAISTNLSQETASS